MAVATLTDPVTALSGVGPARAGQLAKLGIETVQDLLFVLPRRYMDFSQELDPNRLRAGHTGTVIGQVARVTNRRTRSRRMMVTAHLKGGDRLTLVWFRPTGRRIPPPVKVGQTVAVAGKVTASPSGLAMVHPMIAKNSAELARIFPVYPLTSGLTQNVYRRCVHTALPAIEQMRDSLPGHLSRERQLPDLKTALRYLHRPTTMTEAEMGARRLAYGEALALALAVRWRRQWQTEAESPFRCGGDGAQVHRLASDFPFSLTKAQEGAFADVRLDMESGRPMQRLIHGDVGSGKTVIAMYAAVKAAENGFQAALLTPTRVLAEQHYRHWDAALSKAGINAALLTSGSSRDKTDLFTGLAGGKVDLLIGTHAILDAPFARLGLVVVDEQQRFGVEQRAQLTQRGNPHCLYLTATPIPRSLALVSCADLDVSLLAEKPAGRRPVETRWIDPSKRSDVYSFVKRRVLQGEQAFVVLPRIEEDESEPGLDDEGTWTSVTSAYRELKRGPLQGLKVGMLHGGMPSEKQEATLSKFAQGDIQVLVTTTVIEVGVDVPAATVMVIEHADLFGLSQLHQLRGRVGRGNTAAYCLLVAAPTTPQAGQRISALRSTHDGFVLAEEDLKLRGPGELLGSRQSGFGALEYVELARDAALVDEATADARAILAEDPTLEAAEHRDLRADVLERFPSLREVEKACE